jgi:hypothetical protein
MGSSREALLNGKAQYSRPPCTNLFRSAAFENENITYYLTKQATLMRRSIVLIPPLQLVFLGSSQSGSAENLNFFCNFHFFSFSDQF